MSILMNLHNVRLLSVVIASAVMTVSCASQPGASDAAPTAKSAPAIKSTAAKSGGSPSVSSSTPIAPADARLTLYCLPIGGIGHVERAKNLKDELVKKTGWTDFYLVHSDGQSILYYGYYRDFIGQADPKERKRADADREKIIKFQDDRHDNPFRGAAFVTLDAPDPQSPPEWNLSSTPPDKMWTLEVGVYYDSPMRKQYAVDAVRQARAMGIEAYYYHGDSVSSVCVGAFPREALKEQESANAETYRSNEPIVVLPGPLPAGASDDVYVMQDGQKVKAKAMTPRIEPQDPKLIDLQKRFPHRSVNGEETVTMKQNKRTGQTIPVYDPSLIVPIKRPHDLAGIPQPGMDVLPPPTATGRPPQSGSGQLRGLSDR